MSAPVRILMVEDVPSDAELTLRELRAGGIEFVSERVEGRDEYLGALRRFVPDIVLSDYRLPAFDAMQALQLLRERDPWLPFIVITGSINEDTAVECMKAGASDYVIKASLRRLPMAVRAALERHAGQLRQQEAERALRRAQEQLAQSQKMEAIGRLAGGVAHDFNNLLTVIRGYTEVLLQRLGPDDGARPLHEAVAQAAERATRLTRQLLAFSRRQVLEPRVVDLGDLLRDMEAMLRRLIGEDVELVVGRPAELGHVRTDPGQFEQVVLNLTVNARDAMPQGGTLRLELSDTTLDESQARDGATIVPGPYVQLTVSDTGAGIPAAVQPRIFEPFFTTKERGQGTGLGLSMVYGIVKQSEGYIWVDSEPGRGTTFRILLPRVDARVEQRAPAPPLPSAPGAGETVLLVEDDAPAANSRPRATACWRPAVPTRPSVPPPRSLASICCSPISCCPA
jgi:two-component system, cell cycle sensor histidine kinase and response regulator CckA